MSDNFDSHKACTHTCPGGNACCCSTDPHTLCICKEPDCYCHTQARYADAAAHDPSRKRPAAQACCEQKAI